MKMLDTNNNFPSDLIQAIDMMLGSKYVTGTFGEVTWAPHEASVDILAALAAAGPSWNPKPGVYVIGADEERGFHFRFGLLVGVPTQETWDKLTYCHEDLQGKIDEYLLVSRFYPKPNLNMRVETTDWILAFPREVASLSSVKAIMLAAPGKGIAPKDLESLQAAVQTATMTLSINWEDPLIVASSGYVSVVH
jgi:hypothetical protein